MINEATSHIDRKSTKNELGEKLDIQGVRGDSKDVVNIGLSLDVGDISGLIDGDGRQNLFSKLWGRFDFDNKEQE